MKGREYHSVELVVISTEIGIGLEAPQIPETEAVAFTVAPTTGFRVVALTTLREAPNGCPG